MLHFPNLDVLRLALTSGAVPETMRRQSAHFVIAQDQTLWVEPTGALDKASQKELGRLGVKSAATGPKLTQEAAHWLQLFPLVRTPRSAEASDKTPVLFELERTEQLAELAGEMLRLGNDRQSFRWLDENKTAKGLLRVIGPPYYSLLRSLDGKEGAPIAYREVAPRVWVQLGCTHPLGEQVQAPAGQMLLLSAPRQWTQIPEAKWRDIYEVIDFHLPDAVSPYHDVELPNRMRVPVKLTRGGAGDAAELWVLGETGIAQLEEFVRSSDNELLDRLAFAVGEKDGARMVALRVRPSKGAPPVLVLDGAAFRSYLRIPNLFVPLGLALQPPLRRDAVIRLLAEDRTRITWLHAHADGTFTPRSLPDNAFRPLSEWIDYVLEHEGEAMKVWLGAMRFQFESFICKDDVDKKRPEEPRQPKDPTPTSEKTDQPARPVGGEKKKSRKQATFTDDTARVEPGALEIRLRELEEEYLGLHTPLEDPTRQAILRELADVNARLNQPAEAFICWASALWELPGVAADGSENAGDMNVRAILRVVSGDGATHANVRQVARFLIERSPGFGVPHPGACPDELRPHLGKLQQYLEKHETQLGVRGLWLAWHALYRLSSDVLMLARARDRVLERLFLSGLSADLDLPAFLRFTGAQVNHRMRGLHDQISRLHEFVQKWAARGPVATKETHSYIDLIFAYGLARLGETSEARRCLANAQKVLANADEVHSWLCAAFTYRVQQAFDGKPAHGFLAERLLTELSALDQGDSPETIKRGRDLRLMIDRMREKSRILEPQQRIDGFDHWTIATEKSALVRDIAELADIHDRGELADRLQKMLKTKGKYKRTANAEFLLVRGALKFAPRLGQEFADQMLERAAGLYDKLKEPRQFAELLDVNLFVAGHFEHKREIEKCVARLENLLSTTQSLPYAELVSIVAVGFRSLRKLGLRDTVAQLMDRLGGVINAELASTAASSFVNDKRGKMHCLLLELAAGWFYFGDENKARKILDDARNLLSSMVERNGRMEAELYNINQTELAHAYLSALGPAPPAFALGRIMEFFRKIEGVYDTWYTSLKHFSLTRLMVVEAMMLALVSDDFAIDPEARKRLDDDEYLVRRRIHRDVHEAMTQAEM